MPETPPCQKYACDIQDCLQKNNYQESKCEAQLVALRKCCEELLDNNGSSVCCPVKKYGKQAREKKQ
ncbi:uncharacterized protein BYT42DRAFT_568512 [Radiomyces spectabilis]|uniref:uncharacterized protein n=1 Tax=Radiomyces spectabilis TaxID=64574 RepID=UPI0022210A0E|nr:uncharacterized protein BYT42DRAFT_568512 [Radiomyces spectabilis]KAI8379360.1 hypothetical protein BYT42DRAFT_568512 [Radiomyces spectabilis]